MGASSVDPQSILVVDAIDPRGRRVQCSLADWQAHVLAARGQTFDSYRWHVNRAIAQPDQITQDRDDPRRECYYASGLLPLKVKYLKVVAKKGRFRKSWLVTAHPATDLKKGETRIWPK